MEDEQLTSVHAAIQNAVLAAQPLDLKDASILVRVEGGMKRQVARICEQNGVTVSEFLRQCCAGLVRDYTGNDEAVVGD